MCMASCLQAWCDYACFCLRRGALGKAEECLHRALALEQKHAPSLSALACLSLQRGLHGVHGAWEAAEAAAHALKEADARDARSWALLGLAYKLQGAWGGGIGVAATTRSSDGARTWACASNACIYHSGCLCVCEPNAA